MTDIFKRPIILAADVQTETELHHLLSLVESKPYDGQRGNPHVIVKVGLEFVLAHGAKTLGNMLRDYHPPLMLDVKLADIGNTNAKSLENLLNHLTPAILTVSGLGAGGKGIKAVRKVIDTAGIDTQLVATTVLTNWEHDDVDTLLPWALDTVLADVADSITVRHVAESNGKLPRYFPAMQEGQTLAGFVAEHIAKVALENGAHGVVCSGFEAALMRKLGASLVITPGIRPVWAADKGDQARVMTPAEAFAAGATHLVLGRPLTGAAKFGLTTKQAIDRVVAESPLRQAA